MIKTNTNLCASLNAFIKLLQENSDGFYRTALRLCPFRGLSYIKPDSLVYAKQFQLISSPICYNYVQISKSSLLFENYALSQTLLIGM